MMTRRLARLAILSAAVLVISSGMLQGAVCRADAASPAQVQIYGAWHCSDDYCTWGKVRDVAEFDRKNHWLVDRGDGQPSVNLVVLSFVNPLKLLNGVTDATTLNGVPKGMTADIVSYFRSKGIRVMLSIGGITYTTDWNTALKQDAAGLGRKAAAVASQLGVGIEIDYEENRSPNLAGLQAFIGAYRSLHHYGDADAAAKLTIDLAAGDRWLIGITAKATTDWLRKSDPVLDFANAMVPSRQPTSSGAIANWQEHVDGKPQYAPPIPPLSPAMFTGSVYIAEGSRVLPECNNFNSSLQKSTAPFVQSVASKVPGDTSVGMLGWMFWAAEKPSVRGVSTQPPNGCERGVGAGAAAYEIPILAP
jgi:hypothetical protein